MQPISSPGLAPTTTVPASADAPKAGDRPGGSPAESAGAAPLPLAEDTLEAMIEVGDELTRNAAQDYATKLFENLAGLIPDHAHSHRSLGLLAMQRGDLSASREHLEKAIRLDPRDAEAYLLLGETLFKADDLESAAGALEKGLEMANAVSEDRLRSGRRLLATVLRLRELVRSGASELAEAKDRLEKFRSAQEPPEEPSENI